MNKFLGNLFPMLMSKIRAVDPDQHGSALILPPGSGSTSERSREKTEKCKGIGTGGSFLFFVC